MLPPQPTPRFEDTECYDLQSIPAPFHLSPVLRVSHCDSSLPSASIPADLQSISYLMPGLCHVTSLCKHTFTCLPRATLTNLNPSIPDFVASHDLTPYDRSKAPEITLLPSCYLQPHWSLSWSRSSSSLISGHNVTWDNLLDHSSPHFVFEWIFLDLQVFLPMTLP